MSKRPKISKRSGPNPPAPCLPLLCNAEFATRSEGEHRRKLTQRMDPMERELKKAFDHYCRIARHPREREGPACSRFINSPPRKVKVGRICYPRGVLLRIVLDNVFLQLPLPAPGRGRARVTGGVYVTGGSSRGRRLTVCIRTTPLYRLQRSGQPDLEPGWTTSKFGILVVVHTWSRRV